MPRKTTPAAAPAITAPHPSPLPGLEKVLADLDLRRRFEAPSAPLAHLDHDDEELEDFDIPEAEGTHLDSLTEEESPRNAFCDIREALIRLRLETMLSGSGFDSLYPAPGCLSVISVVSERDRPVVQVVLSRTLESACHGFGIYAHKGGPSDRSLKDFADKIRGRLLAAESAIAILPSATSLPDDLRSVMAPEMALPPLTRDMFKAVLEFHFHAAPLDLRYTDRQIARLSDLALVAIFASHTLEDARAVLDRAVAGEADHIGVTLDQIHGQPDAVSALRQAVNDVHDFQAGRIDWAEVTKSFLLMGPPGTGKTMLAQALAGSAGVGMVKTSYSDCQKEGHQGDMLKALAGAVESAITNAPSVFFIDEIDSFHNRKGRMGSKDGYIIGVVNGLLTQLDRLSATPGVILIAATNYPDRVDPAVIRAGRFDKHIRVGKPDRSGIRAMLTASLGAMTGVEGLDTLSDQLLGLTGAEVAAMLRDARTRARAERTSLAMTHIRAAADAIRPPIAPGLMRRIAVHEAGHVLAGHLLGLPEARFVRITPGDGYVLRSRPMFRIPETVHRLICSHVAGRIAEELIFDIPCDGAGNGPESDLAQATRLAVEAECAHGFGESLAWVDPDTPFHTLPLPVQTRVEARLQSAADHVRRLFLAHRTNLERIAGVLLERRELDADAIAALMRDIPRSGDHAEIGKGMTHGF